MMAQTFSISIRREKGEKRRGDKRKGNGGKGDEMRLDFSPRLQAGQNGIDRNKARQEATETYAYAVPLHPNNGVLCAKCLG